MKREQAGSPAGILAHIAGKRTDGPPTRPESRADSGGQPSHRQSDFHARAKAAQLNGGLILGRPTVWAGACKTAVESGVLL